MVYLLLLPATLVLIRFILQQPKEIPNAHKRSCTEGYNISYSTLRMQHSALENCLPWKYRIWWPRFCRRCYFRLLPRVHWRSWQRILCWCGLALIAFPCRWWMLFVFCNFFFPGSSFVFS